MPWIIKLPRRAVGRAARRRSRAAHRSRCRRSRRSPGCAAAGPARPRPWPAADGTARRRRRASTPRRSIRAITSAGASCCRSPTSATGSSRRRATSCTTCSDDPHERTNIVADRAQAAAAHASPGSRRSWPGATSMRRPRFGRGPRAARGARLRRHAVLRAGRAGRRQLAARSEGQGAGAEDSTGRPSTLLGRSAIADARRLLSRSARGQPGDDRRLGAVRGGARRGSAATEALEAYKQVIRLQAGRTERALGAASVLLDARPFDEARAHAELAIESAPAQAHQALANIAVAQKDYAEAQRRPSWRRRRIPTLPMPAFIRGMIAYSQQQYARRCRSCPGARPDGPRARMQPGPAVLHRRHAGAARALSGSRALLSARSSSLYPSSMRARIGPGDALAVDEPADEAERVIADDAEACRRRRAAYRHRGAALATCSARPDRAAAVGPRRARSSDVAR